jgi:hypothetical protein
MQLISHFQDEGDLDPYSLQTTPDPDAVAHSASPASFTPVTSAASSSKVKSEVTSKTPSRASTPRSKTVLKRTLQDAFAEGSAKETLILERLGAQKHERAIGELELKRRKLENQAMEKQHQREREREQHEYRMLQMRIMMSQGQQGAATRLPAMTQPHGQPLFDGYGLMAELNADSLPSENPSHSGSYSI